MTTPSTADPVSPAPTLAAPWVALTPPALAYGEVQLAIHWPEGSARAAQTLARTATRIDVSILNASSSVLASASLDRVSGQPISTASLVTPVAENLHLEATVRAGGESIAMGVSDRFEVRRNQVSSATVSLRPTISSPAGTDWGYSGDGGAASHAQLDDPIAVGVGPDGALYVEDDGRGSIRVITPDGLITPFLGDGTPGPQAADLAEEGQAASVTRAFSPYAMHVNAAGDVYFTDIRTSDSLQPLSSATGSFLTNVCLVPHASARRFGRDMQAGHVYTIYRGSKISNGCALLEDRDGSLLIAENENRRIVRLSAQGDLAPFLGIPSGTIQDSTPGSWVASSSVTLGLVCNLALDGDGNLLFGDRSNLISLLARKAGSYYGLVDARTDRVYTLANKSQTLPAGRTQVNYWGMAMDSSQNLYFADANVGEVYRLTRANGRLERVVGHLGSSAPQLGDGGAADEAQLSGPHGLAFDSQDRLYVADSWNSLIRRVYF